MSPKVEEGGRASLDPKPPPGGLEAGFVEKQNSGRIQEKLQVNVDEIRTEFEPTSRGNSWKYLEIQENFK